MAAVPPAAPCVPIDALPVAVRCLFPYRQFNIMQSQCIDVAFSTNRPFVLSAPTGAGKTAVIEMCLARLWASEAGRGETRTAAVYIAPLKALTAERIADWKRKLDNSGLQIHMCELTGDSKQEDEADRADLIVTTPEKWDSFTRFRRSAHGVMGRIGLCMIDEIHLLAEPDRGPTLEAIVARMKLHARDASAQGLPITRLRLVGISATISNIRDIAHWFDRSCAVLEFGPEYRPVPLTWHVLSFPMKVTWRFDEELKIHVFPLVRRYCNSRPSLVFCNSRSNTSKVAAEVARQAGRQLVGSGPQAHALARAASDAIDGSLAEMLRCGVGFHHAGLDARDKRLVETIFAAGELPILCSTSGLAQGVNLPAHLVVLCNTCKYASSSAGFVEYSRMEVIQMAGRAGRPQFDSSGTCIVMCRQEMSLHYKQILGGQCTIESRLHEHMVAHLNAEIASQLFMNTVENAIEWLRATFFFVRVKSNPSLYKLPRGLTESELEERLTAMCRQKLQSLAEAGMIEVLADESGAIRPLQLGYLMARFCVEMETMRLFQKLPRNCGEAEVLELLSSSTEIEGGTVLRHNEKKALAAINASEKKIRYPIDGSRKAKCKTAASKAFLLLQLRAGGSPLEGFEDVKPLLIEKGSLILRAMVEYAEKQRLCNVLLSAERLHKSLLTGAGWHDAVTAQFQQFSGVGVHFAARLSEASGGSLASFAQLTSLKVEQIMPKGPAVLAEARALLRSALRFDGSVETLGESRGAPASAPLRVAMHVRSVSPPMPFAPVQSVPDSRWRLLVASADGQLLLSRKLNSVDVSQSQGLLSFSLAVPRQNAKHHLVAHLYNERSFGLDSSGHIKLPGATDLALIPPAEAAAPAPVPNRGSSTAPKAAAGDGSRTPAPSQSGGPAQQGGSVTGSFDILAVLDVDDSDDEDQAESQQRDSTHKPFAEQSLDAEWDPDADLFGDALPTQSSQDRAAGARLKPPPRDEKRPAAPSVAGVCNHTCKDKSACGHLCCKDGKIQKNRGREKTPGRGTAARSHKATPPPKPDPRASAFFDRFRAPQPPAVTPKSKPSPPPVPEDTAGPDLSSDAIAVRDGNALTTHAMPGAGGRSAHGEGKPHSTGAGGKHMEHLQAMARSVPSTPVRRLPIAPLPDDVQPARSPATWVAPKELDGATSAPKPIAPAPQPYVYREYVPHKPQPPIAKQRMPMPQPAPGPQPTPHPLQPQIQPRPKAPQQLFPAWPSQKPAVATAGRQPLPPQTYQPMFENCDSQMDARYCLPNYPRPSASSAAQSLRSIPGTIAPGHRARFAESGTSTVEHEPERAMFDDRTDTSARHTAPSSHAASAAAQYPVQEACIRPSISFGHGKQLSRGVLDWLGDDAPKDESGKRARPTSPKRQSPPKKPAKDSMANLAQIVSSGPFLSFERPQVPRDAASGGLFSRSLAQPRGDMGQPRAVSLPTSLASERRADREAQPSAGGRGRASQEPMPPPERLAFLGQR